MRKPNTRTPSPRQPKRGQPAARRVGTQSSVARRAVRSSKPNRKKRAARKVELQIDWGRIVIATVSSVLAVVAGAGVTYLGHRGYVFVTTTDALAVHQIDMTGLDRADREAIVRLLGIEPGANLLSLDTTELERRVIAHPWVAEASVERLFPHRLAVHVEEHKPVVMVALDGLYYANAQGEIVKRHAPGETESLAVITGLTKEQVEAGDGRAQAKLRRAIGFVEDVRVELGDAVTIDEIHLDPITGLSFTPGQEKTRVMVGRPPWRASIRRWGTLRAEMKRRGIAAHEITLGGERRPGRAVAKVAANQ